MKALHPRTSGQALTEFALISVVIGGCALFIIIIHSLMDGRRQVTLTNYLWSLRGDVAATFNNGSLSISHKRQAQPWNPLVAVPLTALTKIRSTSRAELPSHFKINASLTYVGPTNGKSELWQKQFSLLQREIDQLPKRRKE